MHAPTEPLARVLVVDDEAPLVAALCDTLDDQHYEARGFTSAGEALAALHASRFDILLTDLSMPEMDGVALLRAALEIDADLVGIIMTGQGTVRTAVEAMKTGAHDYILKPFKLNALLPVIARAAQVRRLRSENIQLRAALSIYELSVASAFTLDAGHLLDYLAMSASRQSQHADAAILFASDSAGLLRLTMVRGAGRGTQVGAVFPFDARLASWVEESRKALAGTAQDKFLALAADHPFVAEFGGVALPMIAQGRLIGVLIFRQAEGRAVTPGQIKALEVLASIGASALAAAQLHEHVRQLNAELETRVRERTAEIEAVNQELEAFSYSVSHDLRAPLRAIEGFARILVQDHAAALPADGRQHLERISNEARRMAELIDDLLALSQIGRQALSLRPVAVERLAREVFDELHAENADRNIDLRLGTLPECRADISLFRQVLVNLIGNALKFTRGRDPAVIEIGASEGEDETLWSVRDNGAGFDMRYAEKLFGAFQRLHPHADFEGSGIGLSIVARIVARHGGRVWAEGRMNEGATFFFTLPR